MLLLLKDMVEGVNTVAFIIASHKGLNITESVRFVSCEMFLLQTDTLYRTYTTGIKLNIYIQQY